MFVRCLHLIQEQIALAQDIKTNATPQSDTQSMLLVTILRNQPPHYPAQSNLLVVNLPTLPRTTNLNEKVSLAVLNLSRRSIKKEFENQ
ncbi:hypothetical protein J6590_096323 [Homalodisca vitripennis]|nr:hypothetical protein J6590_096323 [Homalodisca vitripennis]